MNWSREDVRRLALVCFTTACEEAKVITNSPVADTQTRLAMASAFASSLVAIWHTCGGDVESLHKFLDEVFQDMQPKLEEALKDPSIQPIQAASKGDKSLN